MKPLPVKLPVSGTQRRSSTELTLALLRDCGYFSGIVERRNPQIRYKTHDLFGIIDIIALTGSGTLGVQSTGKDFAGHWTKLTVTYAKQSARWIHTPGNSLVLVSWRKIKRGTSVLHRAPRIRFVTMPDLLPALQQQSIQSEDLVADSIEELKNAAT